VSLAKARRCRIPTHTPVSPLPIKQRQNAIAKAGAAVAAIIGPLSEMKMTATPRRAISGFGGRDKPGPWDPAASC